MQSVTNEIGQFLLNKNWSVRVISNRYPKTLKHQENIDGLEVKRYFFLSNPIEYLRSGRIDLFFLWMALKPLNFLWLFTEFYRFKPKIVNLHFPDHQLLECILLKIIFRFKLIISLHGNEVDRMEKLRKKSIKYYFYNKIFQYAYCITGCSKYLINKFEIVFPHIDSNKYIILYNGVSDEFINHKIYEQKSKFIFSAGRFVPVKGLDLLLEANKSLKENHLIIAGGFEKDLLKLGLRKEKNINLIGPISKMEIAKYLSTTQLTAIPSKIEAYGILLAEALCCGSPVVITNVGGISETISLAKNNLNSYEKEIFDHFVILVEPDAFSIKNGIETLMNSNIISQFLELVPKIRTEFKWSKRLEDFYDLLL